MILAAIQYNNTGEMFLNIYSVEYGTMYARDGLIRIYSCSGIIMTSAVVSIGSLFSKANYKLLHIVNLALSFWHIYYVQGTRMVIVTLSGVLIAAMFLFETRHKILRVLVMAGLVICGIFALASEISFTTTEVSFVNRVYAYKYFTQYGFTHLFGIGTLTESDTLYLTILHGSKGIAYVSDVGIIGVLGNLGVVAFVWYFYVIFKFGKIRVKKNNKLKLCFIVFYLLSMFTMVPIGYNNMIFFPISMAICEYSAIIEQKSEVELKNA